ncbi:MAG: hypothetical protein WAU91_12790 [Desulfatitalea sp.]
MNRFYYWFFPNYWWLLPALFAATVGLPLLLGVLPAGAMLYALLGLYGMLFFFAQKQRLADQRLAAELLRYFDERHGRLQPALRAIQQGEQLSQALSADQMDVLCAYFNLCSQVYFYYGCGHIPPEVWQSWRNAMRIYYYNPRIRRAWDAELKHDTHYGFGNHLLT